VELSADLSIGRTTLNTRKNKLFFFFIKNPAAGGACSATASTPGTGCFVGNIISTPMNSQGLTLLQPQYNSTIVAHPQSDIPGGTNSALTLSNYNYTTNNSSDRSYYRHIVHFGVVNVFACNRQVLDWYGPVLLCSEAVAQASSTDRFTARIVT